MYIFFYHEEKLWLGRLNLCCSLQSSANRDFHAASASVSSNLFYENVLMSSSSLKSSQCVYTFIPKSHWRSLAETICLTVAETRLQSALGFITRGPTFLPVISIKTVEFFEIKSTTETESTSRPARSPSFSCLLLEAVPL